MKYKIWTARERDYMRRHYGLLAPQSLATWEIARDLGKTIREVHAAASRFGLTWRTQPGKKERRGYRRQFWTYYQQGLHDGQIARKVGCAVITVFLWRRECGLPHHRRLPLEKIAQVAQLRQQGLSHRQIAREVGVALGSVGRCLELAREVSREASTAS